MTHYTYCQRKLTRPLPRRGSCGVTGPARNGADNGSRRGPETGRLLRCTSRPLSSGILFESAPDTDYADTDWTKLQLSRRYEMYRHRPFKPLVPPSSRGGLMIHGMIIPILSYLNPLKLFSNNRFDAKMRIPAGYRVFVSLLFINEEG